MERQFRKYINQALKSRGNTGEVLLTLLEKRLDNVVYRLGFTPTRMMARQLVSHRHVLLNNMKVNIPSYQVKKGDIIMLTAKALEMPPVKKLLSEKEVTIPGWLERKGAAGKISKEPKREDIIESISEQDIVEFYSR